MKKYLKKIIGWIGNDSGSVAVNATTAETGTTRRQRLEVAPYIERLTRELRRAGYETYIVGGAVRDLLLGREPKDYDIATAATPEEIRNVFGRRQARIIGKRFKLVHVHAGGEIVEVSTFRRAPSAPGATPAPLRHRDHLPEKLIFDDNEFGNAFEDAMRRDFTVNALFYDTESGEIRDFTGQGLADIEAKTVRAIGNPDDRFEEDPVRLLRALKLAGQYDFSLEPETDRAVRQHAALLCHASPSRLTLELEKILKAMWSHRIFAVAREYGLLQYFLSFLDRHWGSPQAEYAMRLLEVRNQRVDKGLYRASISIAMASLVLPFVELEQGNPPGRLWNDGDLDGEAVEDTVRKVLTPHCMIKRLIASSERIIMWQPLLRSGNRRDRFGASHNFAHSFEFLKIQNEAMWQSEDLAALWRSNGGGGEPEAGEKPRKRRRRKRGGKTGKTAEAVPAAVEGDAGEAEA